MSQTILHRGFAGFKRWLPPWLWRPVRGLATALLTPIFFSVRTGHFKSSWRMNAVSRGGDPLPWYAYPCIDFLATRDFSERIVLEFGGGQSTRWWAARARAVVTLEADPDWSRQIRERTPGHVRVFDVTMTSPEACAEDVSRVLEALEERRFDVVVIDGLHRRALVEIAQRAMSPAGAIICDNAEGYGFHEAFRDSGLNRVDFFGYAPGVVLPHCTSIYFPDGSFVMSCDLPMPGGEAEG